MNEIRKGIGAESGGTEVGSPMARRVLEALTDRSPRSLPASASEMEAGSHLTKLIGRTRSGNFRLDLRLASILGVDTWSADPGNTGFELRSVATPESVLGGLDRHLERQGIETGMADPAQAAEVVVDIRRTLAQEGPVMRVAR